MRRRHTSQRLSRHPREEPFGASDGRRACKLNTGSQLPVALRGPVRGNISTDSSVRPHTHLTL
eukprot:6553883-Prymnesium_polylepis.1